MENQNTQTTSPVNNATANAQPVNSPASSSGKKFPLVGLVVLLLVIILLVAIISGAFKGSGQQATGGGQQTVLPRVATPNAQQQEVSQEPITSQQDTVKALQQIDSTNPDTVGADLDLNTQDASSFSQ